MKTGFRLFLTLFYLLVTVGLTVTRHWCGERLASTDIAWSAGASLACCCEVEGTPGRCCYTEKATIQLSDDHTSPDSRVVPSFSLESSAHHPLAAATLEDQGVPVADAPLLGNAESPPLQILHCTFLI